MEYTTQRLLRKVVSLSLVLAMFVPVAASAATKKKVAKKPVRGHIAMYLYNPHKRYGDEKVAITDATSRCLTAAAKSEHNADLARAEADGKAADIAAHPDGKLADDYKKYLNNLDVAWGAMEAPYCGFGAFGASAALKAYQKTISRVRTTFLDAVKKDS